MAERTNQIVATTPGNTNVTIIPMNTGTPTAPGPDMVVDTVKVTAGYFTGDKGTLGSANIHTGSLASSNEEYYFNIADGTGSDAATQFSVTYGHYAGSGSDTGGGKKGETQAIYGQLATLLLGENKVSGGFQIGQQGSNFVPGSGQKDEAVYVLSAVRSRMKDRLNRKNWTIVLSGSDNITSRQKLSLTDDSATQKATITVAGPRYNIVSGTQGTVHTHHTASTFGHFYPDVGLLVFSQQMLSSSMGGVDDTLVADNGFADNGVVTFASGSYTGFNYTGSGGVNARCALQFINCLVNSDVATSRTFTSLHASDVKLQFRNEEDKTSAHYFARVRAGEMNFSNNPTWISGSNNQIKHIGMHGNPQVYITSVGLYDGTGDLVAVGKLSSPVKKNFQSETTIKIKLDY